MGAFNESLESDMESESRGLFKASSRTTETWPGLLPPTR